MIDMITLLAFLFGDGKTRQKIKTFHAAKMTKVSQVKIFIYYRNWAAVRAARRTTALSAHMLRDNKS